MIPRPDSRLTLACRLLEGFRAHFIKHRVRVGWPRIHHLRMTRTMTCVAFSAIIWREKIFPPDGRFQMRYCLGVASLTSTHWRAVVEAFASRVWLRGDEGRFGFIGITVFLSSWFLCRLSISEAARESLFLEFGSSLSGGCRMSNPASPRISY